MEFESVTNYVMDTNCSGFSEHSQHVVFLTKLVAASFGILVNVIAMILLLFFQSYYLLIFRICLYILIASLFQICIQLLELFPIVNKGGHNQVRDGWIHACRTLGFLDQVSVWMGHLSMLWLAMYLLYLIRGKKRLEEAVLTRRELVGIGLCFFFPFVFNWIPFMNDYYGFSGSWCWIKITEKACNDTNIDTGLTYILVMYYVPLLIFVLISTLLCAIVFSIWCTTQSNMKEVIFVIIYPLVYDALFVIVTISRIESMIHTANGQPQSYALWIAHAVADPARIIIPSLLAIIYWAFPSSREMITKLKKEHKKKNRKNGKINEKKHLLESS